jgi:hypothetical protein
MAKFELFKTTDVNGEVWYNIKKDGYHVNQSFSKDLKLTEQMFDELVNGKPSEPIVEILKTIENGND